MLWYFIEKYRLTPPYMVWYLKNIMQLNIDRIKYELHRTGLNQSKLAAIIGVSRQLFSYWMLHPDTVKLKRIEQIAAGLGIDSKDLINSN